MICVCISICIFNCIFISNVFVFVCCHICLVWPTGCPRSSSPAEPPASCVLGQEGRQGKAGGDRPYSSSDNTTIPHTTCTRYHTSQCLADTGLLTIQQHHTPTVLVQAELYCNILQESAMRWGNRACLSFSG